MILYLTGSNGYFLSGELATLLTGRYVELSMMPLSFKEFCAGLADDSASLNAKFERYIRSGSFPYVLRYGYGEQEAREYMRGIYNTVLLNDIVKRAERGGRQYAGSHHAFCNAQHRQPDFPLPPSPTP